MNASDARRLTVAALTALAALTSGRAHASLTEAPRLAAAYDTILRAQFDDVDQQLERTCPPAPEQACQALRTVAVWWRIQLDPENRRLDARFNELASAAIAASEAWTRREPDRAEAWFYLAGSYAPLVQWRVLREQRLAAARDGNRIREALERALALDPMLNDAYFGIGLYHYYADVAPSSAKVLRWLLLLPGGDRVKGLQEVERVRTSGALLTGEADFQLHFLYVWYEKKPGRAIELLRTLDQKYPTNPLFLQRVAEIQSGDLRDHDASLATWEMLLDRTRRRSVQAVRLAEVRARFGIATELLTLGKPERAVDHLQAILALDSTEPYGLQARASLMLGGAFDLLARRDLAVAAYTRAIALAPPDDPHHVRERARTALKREPHQSSPSSPKN